MYYRDLGTIYSQSMESFWKDEQNRLAQLLSSKYPLSGAINLIGGIDISFVPNSDQACVCIAILDNITMCMIINPLIIYEYTE